MNMKRTIFNHWQTSGLRIAVCALAISLSTGAYAQTDDEDMEQQEVSAIKKPKRSEVKQKVYPMMAVKGVVSDQATGKPLAGVQLR